MLRIVIEQGDPHGAAFDVPEGESLVGRSHKALVRLNAPDVSGAHVRLQVRGAQLTAENLSRFGALLDGQPMEGAVPVRPGQRLAIGKTTVLRIEEASAPAHPSGDDVPTGRAPAAAAPPSAAKADASAQDTGATPSTGGTGRARAAATVAPPSAPREPELTSARTGAAPREAGGDALSAASWSGTGEGEGATRAMMTRAAGQEEIEFLKQADRQRARSRMTMLTVGILVVLLVSAFFVSRRPPPETTLSWPLNAEGEPLEARVDSPLGGFSVVYPATPSAKVETMTGGVAITCHLGKRGDVPLRIVLEELVDDRMAGETLEQSLSGWRERVTQDGSRWNIDQPLPMSLFLGEESGILFRAVPYTRLGNDGSWSGVANLFRHGRRFVSLRAEVPSKDRAKAEELLYTPFLAPTTEFVRSHWEGGADRPRASSAQVLTRLHEELRRLAPATWNDVQTQLVGVLRKAVAEKNAEDEKDAMDLLVQLRSRQTLWFNEQLVQKESALARGDLDRVRRIAEFCKAVFGDAEDQRFYEVRRWSLDGGS